MEAGGMAGPVDRASNTNRLVGGSLVAHNEKALLEFLSNHPNCVGGHDRSAAVAKVQAHPTQLNPNTPAGRFEITRLVEEAAMTVQRGAGGGGQGTSLPLLVDASKFSLRRDNGKLSVVMGEGAGTVPNDRLECSIKGDAGAFTKVSIRAAGKDVAPVVIQLPSPAVTRPRPPTDFTR
jgi:hypothetical protein